MGRIFERVQIGEPSNIAIFVFARMLQSQWPRPRRLRPRLLPLRLLQLRWLAFQWHRHRFLAVDTPDAYFIVLGVQKVLLATRTCLTQAGARASNTFCHPRNSRGRRGKEEREGHFGCPASPNLFQDAMYSPSWGNFGCYHEFTTTLPPSPRSPP